MGFRFTSLKGLAATLVLSPVFGLGYYAADPDNLVLAPQAEAHIKEVPSPSQERQELHAVMAKMGVEKAY